MISDKKLSGKVAIAANQNIKERDYWLNKLSGEPVKSRFPVDISIESIGEAKPRHMETVTLSLSEGAVSQALRISGGNDHTLHMVLTAAMVLLLDKLSYRNQGTAGDIMLGTTIYRQKDETDFINTILILRNRVESGMSFKELLIQVRQSIIDAVQHQNYPLEVLPKQLDLSISKSDDGFPLFDTTVLLNNIHDVNYLSSVPHNMTFVFDNHSGTMTVDVTYNAVVYSEEYIRDLITRYSRVLESALSTVEAPCGEVDILSEEEKEQLLMEFNQNGGEGFFTETETVQRLFEEQAAKTPDRIAVVSEQASPLTFGRLNERATVLAQRIRKKGIGANHIVGILLDYSEDMIIAILGVLKAGGAYLPIAAETPPRRVRTLLRDSGASLLITTTEITCELAVIPLMDFEEGSACPFTSQPRPQVEDLDKLQVPDRSLIDYEKYRHHIGQAMVKNSITIHMSRGCVYNCAYCFKIWSRKYILRSAENIFNEIKLYYDMGIRRFAFVDDLPNINIEVSSKVFQQIIDHDMKVHLHFPNGIRGDILTPDYIDLMVAAGTITMDLALETTSPRLQKLVRKNLNLKRLEENIKYITEKHPHVILEMQIIHGIPSETEEEAQASLDFIKSVKWVHFPYIHILNIYPQSDMADIAVEHGISREAIARSADLAYHELPETLPFSEAFTLRYQSEFLNEYFLDRERLLTVLPYQMNVLTEDELVQKYDSYLPVEIRSFDQLLEFAGLNREEVNGEFLPDDYGYVPGFNEKLHEHFSLLREEPAPDALRVLMLDLTQYFTHETRIMYDVVEPPLGAMYVMTHLNRTFGSRIHGKIAKSRIDFDGYDALETLIRQFKPDVIGVRSLNFYKDFFHKTVSLIRQWGIDSTIIAGGPYATSNYPTMLKDGNIDLAVLGEGEITFTEVIGAILENNGSLPEESVLKEIPGISFIESKDKHLLEERSRNLMFMDCTSDTLNGEPITESELGSKPGDLAYIIYTSGSTGIPKGVMVEHGNLVNQLSGLIRDFDLDESLHYLLLAAYTFDVSVMHIFLPLVTGSRLHIISEATRKDPDRLWKFIYDNRIDILNIVPTFMEALLESIETGKIALKYLFVGGDVFRPHLFHRLKETFDVEEIINIYGPTETTINATAFRCGIEVPFGESLPIGKPLMNYFAYILNSDNQPMPLGVTGHLHIAGAGVARGYLNRPELTAQKFKKLSPLCGDPGEASPRSSKNLPGGLLEANRLYSTGDLARWLTNGNIEFMGRVDQQVKIRGFRIELGEIEARLTGHPEVKEAVVLARSDENGDQKTLCAYVVPEVICQDGGVGGITAKLKEYLAGILPPYMVPSHLVEMEGIPLTSSGKVDRQALPEPVTGNKGDYVAPETFLQKKLTVIWSEVLGMEAEELGIDANFFEMGGHSLKATILLARIHKELNVRIPMVELFDHFTIRLLAGYMEGMAENRVSDIEPVEQRAYYPLSAAQKRLFILHQMDPHSTAYNMPQVTPLDEDIEDERLETIFRQLLQRHESFRTAILMKSGEAVQEIYPYDDVTINIEYYDAGRSSFSVETITGEFVRPFDLSQAPLVRAGVIRQEGQPPVLLVDMHHVITDGISNKILIREFGALVSGEELPPLPIQYKDYACWQNNPVQQEAVKTQEVFWLDMFADSVPLLDLPLDFPRPTVQKFDGAGEIFILEADIANRLRDISQKEGTTLYMLMVAIFALLLSKLSGMEDIVVGTPVSGRRHADLRDIIGMFVNTVALRHFPNGSIRFRDYLKEVKERTLAAFENQDYQFEDLVDRLSDRIPRDTGRNPLFDVMFSLDNPENMEDIDSGANRLPKDGSIPTGRRVSKFDITMIAFDSTTDIPIQMEYATHLFKRETMQRFARYFRHLCEAVTGASGIYAVMAEMDIMTPEEKQQLLDTFNNTGAAYPGHKTLHQLFGEQVERTPDAVALVYENKHVTYSLLDCQARKTAAKLKLEGVVSDTIVGIHLEPSINMVTAALGILMAGGAYMPIDPAFPEQRKKYMSDDSNCSILIASNTTGNGFQESFLKEQGKAIVYVDDYSWNDKNESFPADKQSHYAEHRNNADDVAYIIYTSGSTGKPKGVLISHRNVVRLMFNDAFPFDFSHRDVWTLFHSFGFDFSVWEMYGPLLYGGRCVVIPRILSRDTHRFLQIIKIEGVTVLNQTPSAFYALSSEALDSEVPPELNSLRYIIFGGEALNPVKLKNWHRQYPQVKLINMYGITETTVHVTYKEITSEDMTREASNIGKPIPTLGVHVLDAHLKLCPPGTAGELCVGGEGLGRGYLNRPELTAGKFIKNPYQTSGMPLLYRSGDLGRIMAGGDLEHVGRIDMQVKIRGFRIELGEIENQLLKYPGVRQAVVVTREHPQRGKYLYAAVTADTAPDTTQLRHFLTQKLPEYMVPAHFVLLEQIPLTANGKVDIAALPDPQKLRPRLQSPYESPYSHLEKTIAAVWAEILDVAEVGVNDNFFDLGGNSLDIVKTGNLLKEKHGLDVQVVSLFEYPTVRTLAENISGEVDRSEKPVPKKTTLGNATDPRMAVIGMSGRFPGADNLDHFWENLKNGVESIAFYTDEELEDAGIDPRLIANPKYVKSTGSVLKDKDQFDADFFDYTPMNAEIMSPQVRILHECVWEALENGGYAPGTFDDAVGLFGGVSSSFDWEMISLFTGAGDSTGYFGSYILGNKDMAATHVSYKLNLKGPAVSIQTACSTSLVALDTAIRAICDRRCRMALVFGLSAGIKDVGGYLYEDGGLQSPDGHCRAFDADAAGLTNGEGGGVILIKPLAEALADNDTIHAVIMGTYVNNDGSRKVGYTAPSIKGQAEVIRGALQVANVPAESITYVETHGTGTPLGDPVEVQGLISAFDSSNRAFCRIGSVKTNIGHLDVGAGIAGIIKTILSLKHREIPPSLFFNSPNPAIDFDNSPFIVNRELIPWKSGNTPRRAGVSSFGIGGTNAHVILEEAPAQMQKQSTESIQTGGSQLLVVSAKNQSALDQAAHNLGEFLAANSGISLADTAYTLQQGRKAFRHRRVVVCTDINDAVFQLNAGKGRSGQAPTDDPAPVIFMFAGLGGQYIGMGRNLYETDFRFRETLDRCFQIIKRLTGKDMKDILYPGSTENDGNSIIDSEIVQPVVFALEFALAKLLMDLGIQPRALIGYSFGEYAAAAIAGVFSLEDALTLVIRRSRLVASLPEGAMLSVPLPKNRLIPLLDKMNDICLAVDNGESCIVSGPEQAVRDFEKQLKSKKLFCLFIPTDRAIHSAMTESILADFQRELERVVLSEPQIPCISNTTGDWMETKDVTRPQYWMDQLRYTVQFDAGICKLMPEEGDLDPLFVEIGPGRDLSTLVGRYVADAGGNPTEQVVNPIRHPKEDVTDDRYLLMRIGQLWLRGCTIDWDALHLNANRHRVPLPTYPFQRSRFWSRVDSFDPNTLSLRGPVEGYVPKKQIPMEDWFYTPSWEQEPLPQVPVDALVRKPYCFLVFEDNLDIGNRLAIQLGEHFSVVLVRPGDTFAVPVPGTDVPVFTLDPGQPDHYDRLLRELKKSGRIPSHIVHMWAVAKDSAETKKDTSPVSQFKRAQEAGFYSLMDLVGATGRVDISGNIRLTVVTADLQEVTGSETLRPEYGTVTGAVKSIQLEYPNIDCLGIDIAVGPDNIYDNRTVDHLYHELIQQPWTVSKEMGFLAFRGPLRWKQIFKPIKIGEPDPSQLPLKEQGVYIITGGFGGMGFSIAQHLAQYYRARLVLIGRSPFPDRDQWRQFITQHGEEHPTSIKIRKVQEMESCGAEVMIFSVDVSDMEKMKALIRQVESRFGFVNGVMHTAAVIDYAGIIQRRTREQTEAVWAPKIYGLLALETLLDKSQLDFFMIFSSVAALFTSFAQVGYVAGNSFLDTYAYAKNRLDGKYAVISWCDWTEVGMAVKAITEAFKDNPAQAALELEALDYIAVNPREGVAAFLRMLARRLPRVVVNIQTLDIMNRMHFNSVAGGRTMDESIAAPTQTGQLHPRPQLGTEYRAPGNDMERTVANALQQYLAIEQVGVDDNFFELGLTSLDIIQVNNRMKEELKMDIPLVSMFSHPTIAHFTQYLQSKDGGVGETVPDDNDTDVPEDSGDLLMESIDLLTD